MRHLIGIVSLLLAPAIHAGVVVASPNLLPLGTSYVGPGWHFPGLGSVDFLNVALSNFSASFLPPQNTGNTATHPFTATVAGTLILSGGPPSFPVVTGAASYFIQKASGPAASSLGTFNTEMLQLDLNLGGGMLIRESPTIASTGSTTISDAGGGLFRIDSFFDIFVELSIDGGQSWIPSTASSRESVVPEPSSLLLAGAGLASLLRTRSTRLTRFIRPRA